MRTWLVMLLLMLLPLQFSAAAETVYCQHESQTCTVHPGHHTHRHAVDADKGAKGSAQAAGDLDCGTCHSACTAMSAEAPARLPISHDATFELSAQAERAPPWQERPYRPQWKPPAGPGLTRSA